MKKSSGKNDEMDKIITLAKNRGFIFQSSEIYGGFANSYDLGPLGVELKRNVKDLWWKFFVQERGDVVGLDANIIMNTKIWEASGHIDGFNDILAECKKCHERYRVDELEEDNDKKINDINCPNCDKKDWTKPTEFNTMFKTNLGPVESKENTVYLRPETAQAMFVDFLELVRVSRKKIPFGVAQIGKAFRNEITPGNFIFRLREFEQMEVEYFIEEPKKDKDWEKHFDDWLKVMREWIEMVGIDKKRIKEVEIPESDRAHYSKKTIDIEFIFPFGQKELYGLAYRTDYDLKSHIDKSGKDLSYTDSDGKNYIPHVIEPSLGVERTILAVLCSAYTEEKVGDETRVVLKLPKEIAPNKVAVLPLSNKPELEKISKKIWEDLQKNFMTDYDDTQSIGKRYRRQDEIGTPFCVTVDFDSLEDKKVTVRNRDSMEQERIKIDNLKDYLKDKLDK